MRRRMCCLLLFSGLCWAATKPHVVSFGKWNQVKWSTGEDESHPIEMKVRPIFVDTRLREFTVGLPHDVTDRVFVVQRAFRLNDALPDEPATPKWTWQRGGWLMIDRISGKISPLNLPEFDVRYSSVTWYRDYVAYCAVSIDGKKSFGVVAQIGRRKLILRKALPDPNPSFDATCSAPSWQRQPARITFSLGSSQKVTYAIRGSVVDLVTDSDEDSDADQD